MIKNPKGAAMKAHLTSIFQKSTIQLRSSVGWKAWVTGTLSRGINLKLFLGNHEKPVQKRQPAMKAYPPIIERRRKGR